MTYVLDGPCRQRSTNQSGAHLKNRSWRHERRTRYELLEARLALSAHSPFSELAPHADVAPPLTHFQQSPATPPPLSHFQQVTPPPLTQFGELAPTIGVRETVSLPLDSPHDFQLQPIDADIGTPLSPHFDGVHQSTGISGVREQFGFTGAGQTVAVIDSGIAWDHIDLGAGFGSGSRIVGGWDFAENDANPYDDGPSGFHGTHVAGIVGGSNERYSGVAPEADLVALRVFDDQGGGQFHWVEQALQWVHTHRNEFANPITTVNLSLGASWNADTIPNWAMLEDEFAQLEADGIFIAVAAGNSFQHYGAPGLSYPAVSPYVVPVASLDPDGGLSDFSQRHDRVLAAPGAQIVSTVPDAHGDNDGIGDDYGVANGTSMASPYVAGASVLVRQAMEFVGVENITQDAIYDQLRNTSQLVFDPLTAAHYHSIDVQAAIDALMPSDDYGAGANSHQLGVLPQTTALDGLIHRLDDVDSFTFTASTGGEMRWSVGNSTHEFAADWTVEGQAMQVDGDLVFDVVAGQSYTVSLGTSAGIGSYHLDIDLTPTDPNLGVVEWTERSGMRFDQSETELSFTASRSGVMTVEAFFASAEGNVNLRVRDASGNVIGFGGAGGDNERVDVDVIAGHHYTLDVIGHNADVDLRLANLMQVGNGSATVHGTDRDDVIAVSAGGNHHIVVNGLEYHLDAAEVRSVRVMAGQGDDTVQMTGSYAVDFGEMRTAFSRLASDDYAYEAHDAEHVRLASLGRDDLLRIHGTAGDDLLTSDVHQTQLTSIGTSHQAEGFERIYIEAGGEGVDTAIVHDTQGADRFTSRADHAILEGVDYYKYLGGFEDVTVIGSSGRDVAEMYDTAGNETFEGRHDVSKMSGNGFRFEVRGFDEVRGHASGGFDEATLFDSTGDDRYDGRVQQSSMRGDHFVTIARGFDRVTGVADAGGRDIANVYDSSANDTAQMRSDETVVSSSGYFNAARGFDQVALRAVNGGQDVVHFYDSIGDDRFYGHSTHALLRGDGFYNQANGFEVSYAHSIHGGHDTAQLYDSAHADHLTADAEHVIFNGQGFEHHVDSFSRVFAFANLGGEDTAEFFDSAGDEFFRATPGQAEMSGADFYNFARGFDRVDAYAVNGGNDSAELRDSHGDDSLIASQQTSRLSGQGFDNRAHGFESVFAKASSGNDHAQLEGSAGDDQLRSSAWQTSLASAAVEITARGFDQLLATGRGGRDHIIFENVGGEETVEAEVGAARHYGPSFDNVAREFETWEILARESGPALTSPQGALQAPVFDAAPDSPAPVAGGSPSSLGSLSTPTQPRLDLEMLAIQDTESVIRTDLGGQSDVGGEEAAWNEVLHEIQSLQSMADETLSLNDRGGEGELGVVDSLFSSLAEAESALEIA